MEENTIGPEPVSGPVCLSCGSRDVQEGKPNPLCSDCRNKFIRFPVPFGIKLFAAGVLAVFIFSMTRLSGNLSAGIHLERGKKAEKHKDYITAQKEYEMVLKKIPGLMDAQSHLLLTAFSNMDFETVYKMSQVLDGKEIGDMNLYNKMNTSIGKVPGYFPSDSFATFLNEYHSSDSIPDEVYKKYTDAFPGEIYPLTGWASALIDQKKYTTADSLLNRALLEDNTNVVAIMLKASLMRELKQTDSAMYYSNRLLELNRESLFGRASKARTLLQQKKDKEGLTWALKAFEISNTSPYAVSTLILARHFNQQYKERDALMEVLKKDTAASGHLNFIKDVLSGKENFRD
ncbi:MAG: hypothetical protein U0U70_02270 [Chitinophagaceae bacterium]